VTILQTPGWAEAAYLEAPEYGDPSDWGEHPRERKPWSRDRNTIRYTMQAAINQRCWSNVDANGWTNDHSMRFQALNHARYEIWRHFFIDNKRMHPTVRAEAIARLKRYVLGARKYSLPPIP
jgi:hypothetical protein